MNKESNSLFSRSPQKFVIPGQSKNGEQPAPDLEFERDSSVPGLYRAKIDREALDVEHGNSSAIKQKK